MISSISSLVMDFQILRLRAEVVYGSYEPWSRLLTEG